MYDDKLNQRAKNFQSVTIKNINKVREERNLTLRKEKIFDRIMDKRLASQNFTDDINKSSTCDIPSSMNGIPMSSIRIPDDKSLYYSSLKEQDKVKALKDWLLIRDYEEEFSLQRFAIFHLRRYFNNLGISNIVKKELMDEDLIRYLMNLLSTVKDIKALYEISYIITRTTYIFRHFNKFFIDSDFIQELILLTYKGNLYLTENILITVGNLMLDDRKFIMEKTGYIDRLKDLLINEDFIVLKEEYPDTTISVIIQWSFNNILSELSQKEIVDYLDLIPYFMNFLCKRNLLMMKKSDKNLDELFQILKIFQNYSNNEPTIETLVKNDLMPQIIYLLQYINFPYTQNFPYDQNEILNLSTEHLLIILRILNNIYSTTNETLGYINDQFDKIVEVFQNLLMRYRFFQENDREIVNEIIWTISNLMALPASNIEKVFLTKIPLLLLTFYFKSNDIIPSVLEVFENALQNGSDLTVIEILKLNFLHTMCSAFKEISKVEAIRSCLNCIKQIMIFSNNIYKGLSEGDQNLSSVTFGIKLELEKSGVITRLEQLCLHNKIEISQYATNLLQIVEQFLSVFD